jgi:hypothetical protein
MINEDTVLLSSYNQANRIYTFCINSSNPTSLHESVNRYLKNLSDEDVLVDIKYTTSLNSFSAFVIINKLKD